MSVFRYPGGKTKLLWRIRPQIDLLIKNGARSYHEPCVGGGAVVASLSRDYPDLKLHINDYDPEMSAFWQVLVNGTDADFGRLFRLIRQTPTVDLFRSLRQKPAKDNVERAYRALFYNRTSYSGIRGSGPLGGYDQSGPCKITGRYRPERIIHDIQMLRFLLHGRTKISQISVIDYMRMRTGENDVVYLDPPYVIKGNSLYPTGMSLHEHKALADVLRTQKNWILSYDRCAEIEDLYAFATRLCVPAKYSVSEKGKRIGVQYEYLILPPGMPLAAESAAMLVEPVANEVAKWVA